MEEVNSSCVVPRARWSLGGIVGASAPGLPLAASAHEQGRFAVNDSHRGLAVCHCSVLLATGRVQRRGRSRVTGRMVVVHSKEMPVAFPADPAFASPPLCAR